MSVIPTPTSQGNSDSTADHIASIAHQSIDRVTLKANHAESELRDIAAKTTDGVKHLGQQARAYIEQNPLTSSGMALAVGAALCMLIRR